MSGIEFTAVSMLIVYRIIALLVGLGFAYLGYRLFVLGVYGKEASPTEVTLGWGRLGMILKQAGPGIYFALFGALVVVQAVRDQDKVVVQTIPQDEVRAAHAGLEAVLVRSIPVSADEQPEEATIATEPNLTIADVKSGKSR